MGNKWNNSERWAIVLYALLAALNTVGEKLIKPDGRDEKKEKNDNHA